MIAEAALVSFVAALFSMMNPIGNLGIFAAVTEDRSETEARRIAWTCATAVTAILVIVALAGDYVLKLFGITVDSIRAAGGIIVLLIGLNMLFNRSEHKGSAEETADARTRAQVAVVPLAIPIVAGPGTIATVIVAAQQHHSILSKLEISIVIAILAAICGFLFSYAKPLSERLGVSGMGVVTRIMGMILASIALSMLAQGLKGLLPGLAG